jgi:hypothetical protein
MICRVCAADFDGFTLSDGFAVSDRFVLSDGFAVSPGRAGAFAGRGIH